MLLERLRRFLERPLVQAFITVFVSYVLTLTGLAFWPAGAQPDLRMDNTPHPGVGLFIVGVFTASHAVVPVFFYAKGFGHEKGISRVFLYFNMGFWYGAPTLGLAFFAGPFQIVGMVAHIAMSPHGQRTWRFLQYGSTNFSLLLFVLMFGPQTGKSIGWEYAAALIYQTLLLTFVERKGRPLWVKNDPPAAPPPEC